MRDEGSGFRVQGHRVHPHVGPGRHTHVDRGARGFHERGGGPGLLLLRARDSGQGEVHGAVRDELGGKRVWNRDLDAFPGQEEVTGRFAVREQCELGTMRSLVGARKNAQSQEECATLGNFEEDAGARGPRDGPPDPRDCGPTEFG